MLFQPKPFALLGTALLGIALPLSAQAPAPAAKPAQAQAAPAAPPATSKNPTARPVAKQAKHKPVNINACTADELCKVPGMSPAAAKRIIAHRPYVSKAELVTKSVISMMFYQGIKDEILVGKPLAGPVKK